jgi:hypothetical protein
MTPSRRTRFGLSVTLAALAACGGDDDGAGPGPDDTPDGGVPAVTCADEHPDLTALMSGIEPEATWDSLQAEAQGGLQAAAEWRLACEREAWGADGLAEKAALVVDDPTPEIDANYDLWVTTYFGGVIPADFSASADVESAALDRGLRKAYLLDFASRRANLPFDWGFTGKNWDGVSEAWDTFLPDPQTMADKRAFGQQIYQELTGIDAGELSADELALRDRVLFLVRSLRQGSTGVQWGAREVSAVYGRSNFGPSPTWGYWMWGETLYPDTEQLLQDQNAMWMAEFLWVNQGTVATAIEYIGSGYSMDPGLYAFLVPDDQELQKNVTLFAQWFGQRLETHPDAGETCAPFSAEERAALEDSFAADMLLPEDFTFADVKTALDESGAALLLQYREAAIAAIDAALTGEDALTAGERAAVVAALEAETSFGRMIDTAVAALDSATGSPAASEVFQAALASVPVIGGDYQADQEVRPADANAVASLWSKVRTRLIARYGGRVVDAAALIPAEVSVNTGTAVAADAAGNIEVGVGLPRNRAVMAVVLVHEALHSLQVGSDLNVEGYGIEGASVHAERTVGIEIARAVAPPALRPIYGLQTISGDTRRWALTDATLAVLQLDDCDGVSSTSDLAIATAASWGLSEEAQAEAPLRAHYGTQFLSYLTGAFKYDEGIRYFEDAIEPDTDNGIDAYDLITCGLPTPPLTPASTDTLAACLGLD